MMAEVASNNTKITDLGSEKGAKVAQNVAAGVVGLVVWPVWFLMDFQGAAGTEIKALQDRNTYLATKVNEDGCGSPTVTASGPPTNAPVGQGSNNTAQDSRHSNRRSYVRSASGGDIRADISEAALRSAIATARLSSDDLRTGICITRQRAFGCRSGVLAPLVPATMTQTLHIPLPHP